MWELFIHLVCKLQSFELVLKEVAPLIVLVCVGTPTPDIAALSLGFAHKIKVSSQIMLNVLNTFKVASFGYFASNWLLLKARGGKIFGLATFTSKIFL